MEEIDPIAYDVVAPLLQTPLAALVTEGLERLRSAESETRPADDPERDPRAPRDEESRKQRVFRQLKILDEAIGGAIALEIRLLEQSRDLAQSWRDRLRARSRAADAGFGAIVVFPSDNALASADHSSPDALDADRIERLKSFLETWKVNLGVLRERIQIDGNL